MKKDFIIVLFLLCSLFSRAGEECRITSRDIADGVTEYSLRNDFIEIKCVPETSGVISGLTSLPENREMIRQLECTVDKDDLLPTRCHTNLTGFRELVRGVKMSVHTKYSLQTPVCSGDSVEFIMTGRGFYLWNIDAVKRIMLRKGESGAKITLTLTAASDILSPICLWINGIAYMGKTERDTVLIPVRNTSERRFGLAMTAFPEEGVFPDRELNPQSISAAAGAPWIARTSPEGPGVLVMRLDKSFTESGVLYTWKQGTSSIHTTEAIYGPVTLKKGESKEITAEYLYFAELTGLLDIAGPYGLDRKGNVIEIASAAPVPAGIMTLNWHDASGRSGDLGDFSLPALIPGQIAKIDLSGRNMPEKCTIGGTLPGGLKFNLPGLVEKITGQ